MRDFDTLVEALKELRKEGYKEDFSMEFNSLKCEAREKNLLPDEFEVDEVFRFEGNTNPSDMSILYAISSSHHDLKGVLVSPYGAYADPIADKLMAKLQA